MRVTVCRANLSRYAQKTSSRKFAWSKFFTCLFIFFPLTLMSQMPLCYCAYVNIGGMHDVSRNSVFNFDPIISCIPLRNFLMHYSHLITRSRIFRENINYLLLSTRSYNKESCLLDYSVKANQVWLIELKWN